MTRIAILPERTDDSTSWRAIAGDKQSVGRTAGEALDAIAAQLDDEAGGTLIIMQTQRPDRYFTAEERSRLEHLMANWREARDTGVELLEADQAELEALTRREVEASALRVA